MTSNAPQTRPLAEATKAYFSDQRLSAAQLAELRSLAADISYKPAPRPCVAAFRYSAIAASVLLAITVGFWIQQSGSHIQPIEQMALEVAHNHYSQKPLEFKGDNVAALQPHFRDNGIALLEPGVAALSNSQLLGARHCSLLAVSAAQLRYASGDGKLISLYQAPYLPKRHGKLPDSSRGEAAVTKSIDGLTVRLWRQNDTVFGSASTETEPQ